MSRLNSVKHDQQMNGFVQAAVIQEQRTAQQVAYLRAVHLDVTKLIYTQLVVDAAREGIKAAGESGEIKTNLDLPFNIAKVASDRFMVRMGLMQEVPAPQADGGDQASGNQAGGESKIIQPE